MAFFNFKSVEQQPHHTRLKISGTRARYRDGKRDTAVKTYTVSQESFYLLIQGVPAVGVGNELKYLCEQYGDVEIHHIDEYTCQDHTEAYLVKYNWFPAARTAKRHLDDKPFFGGILHVCYAPEFETVQDTSQKLQERRKYVSTQLRTGNNENTKPNNCGTSNTLSEKVSNFKSMNCSKTKNLNERANSQTNNRDTCLADKIHPVSYIWAGKEYTVYPQSIHKIQSDSQVDQSKPPSKSFIPRQLTHKVRSVKEDHPIQKNEITSESATLPNISTQVQKCSVSNVKVSLKRRKMQ